MYKYVYAGRSGDQFFADEEEISDFVSECAKRCIAAKRESLHKNIGFYFLWLDILFTQRF